LSEEQPTKIESVERFNATTKNEWVEPKLAIDVGRGLIAIFLAFSAISLAMKGKVEVKYEPYAFLISAFCLVLVARTFDWMLDRINMFTWAKLFEVQNLDDFEIEFKRLDGALFRIKLYGGAYFIFVIAISVIASFSMLYSLGMFKVESHLLMECFSVIRIMTPIIVFVYIPYQMLTISSKGSLPFFILSLVSIISAAIGIIWL